MHSNAYCYKCNKTYDWSVRHRCVNTCRCCKVKGTCRKEASDGWKHCKKFRRFFQNKKCCRNHLALIGKIERKSICDRIYKCKSIYLTEMGAVKLFDVLNRVDKVAEIHQKHVCRFRNRDVARFVVFDGVVPTTHKEPTVCTALSSVLVLSLITWFTYMYITSSRNRITT